MNMVDIGNQNQQQKPEGDIRKIRSLMGRTPSLIKTKFLEVLGNSNDLITEFSNKLDAALSLSSSETESTLEKKSKLSQNSEQSKSTGEKLDDDLIDFETRRVKERRAHEEILSGRYRQPKFIIRTPCTTNENCAKNNDKLMSNSSSSDSNSEYVNFIETNKKACDTERGTKTPIVPKEIELEYEKITSVEIAISPSNVIADHLTDCKHKETVTSCSTTSDYEPYVSTTSLESASDLGLWMRSESQNSVPSWASSISLDSQTEESVLQFMKQFVAVLFENSTSITLELKAEFGKLSRTEAGRLWFARLINAQRVYTKRVNETTFYSLVQYFAIVLFECGESDDFTPAKNLMNMCFTFYHEVDVPGCEPYREYLYTYLREQPIWHSLRFWNAAFFDALQCERAHRPVTPTTINGKSLGKPLHDDGDDLLSSIISGQDNSDSLMLLREDQKFQQNITFGQLGTFSCNMHAFGLSRDLCMEFLRKQCIIANLNKDQEKMLQDNINRMYRETDKWSA